MATHIFIPAATQNSVVTTIVETFKERGFEPSSAAASQLSPTVDVAVFFDGVELRIRNVASTLVKKLALDLAKSSALVQLAECEIPLGSRGEQVSASGLRVEEGVVAHLDLDADATAILSDWSDGGPVYEEGEASELLAAALLDRDSDSFRPGQTLIFESKLGGRLGDLAERIRSGASFEWTNVGGRLALKVDDGEGGRRIAVLNDDERRAITEFIDTLQT